MPGDVTGSLVYDARTAEFSFREGPVFTNLLLADEINRTPPKTQASLLEAMEERQVTVDGRPRPLPDPFIVVRHAEPGRVRGHLPAARGPARPLPAQADLPLPAREDEVEVLQRHAAGFDPRDLAARRACGRWPARDDLAAGARRRASASTSRPRCSATSSTWPAPPAPRRPCRSASPRAARPRCWRRRAWAWLSGRDYVTPDDVKALARPTLRHRVALRPEAELEGVTGDGGARRRAGLGAGAALTAWSPTARARRSPRWACCGSGSCSPGWHGVLVWLVVVVLASSPTSCSRPARAPPRLTARSGRSCGSASRPTPC